MALFRNSLNRGLATTDLDTSLGGLGPTLFTAITLNSYS